MWRLLGDPCRRAMAAPAGLAPPPTTCRRTSPVVAAVKEVRGPSLGRAGLATGQLRNGPEGTGDEEVSVVFEFADGSEVQAKGKVGESLLDVVINREVDIDGFGACEGTVACSTCHLVFSQEDFDRLPSKPGDDEMDMLDMAYGLTETSRLGCQVCLTKDLDGLRAKVPEGVNDQR